MHEIPFNAQVRCSDGRCGTSVAVTLHPDTRLISHLIVQDERGEQRMVPLEIIEKADGERVWLRCREADLRQLELFQTTEYVARAPQQSGDWTEEEGEWEDGVDVSAFERQAPGMPVEVERVPPGEIAFHRQTDIEATDGHVGEVNKLVVKAGSGEITHLVWHKGHLWNKRDILIPMSAVASVDYDAVYLNVSKRQVEEFPDVEA